MYNIIVYLFNKIDIEFMNEMAILITCLTFFVQIVKTIYGRLLKLDKTYIGLGRGFWQEISGSYLCLILAPFISILIYFISMLWTVVLQVFWVNNLSENEFILLIFLVLLFVVTEISVFTVFNISLKDSLKKIVGKTSFICWNFLIACMISIFCSYLLLMIGEDMENFIHIFWTSVPISFWCFITVFLVVFYRNIVSCNKCVEHSIEAGLLCITLYIGSYLYSGIRGTNDFILLFILWLLLIVIYVAEYTLCYMKTKGVISLSDGRTENVEINSCWVDEKKISYLKSDYAMKKRIEIPIRDFVSCEWNSRRYNSRRVVRCATLTDGAKIEYTKKKKLKGGLVRYENGREDKKVIIIVTKDEYIVDDEMICDRRIASVILKKVCEFILANNYE